MQNFATWYKTYEDNNSPFPTLMQIRANYVIKILSIEYSIHFPLETLNFLGKVDICILLKIYKVYYKIFSD